MSNLWDGVRFKLDMAQFYFGEMSQDLIPAAAEGPQVYYQPHALPPVNRWAPKFYYHLDAFLVATRSVDLVITTTFGLDKELRRWIATLPASEKKNREAFRSQYDVLAAPFRNHLLTRMRNLSIHRSGSPPVEVAVLGQCGALYRGGPTKGIPTYDAPQRQAHEDPNHPLNWMQPVQFPIEPRFDEFVFQEVLPDGSSNEHPLFRSCEDYLHRASRLAEDAKDLNDRVHGMQPVTFPPLFNI